jgi:hypothetical protein
MQQPAIPFTEKMAEDTIASEISPTRFEKFAADFFSLVDQTTYVTTSKSWDLGRDARPIALRDQEDFPLICCSLRDDIDEKAGSDIGRALSKRKSTNLRFCSTRRISEHRADQIRADLLTKFPQLKTVAVDGVIQIAHLAASRPE